MSEFAEYADRPNIREQIIRIDRAIEEAAKFRAERDKLQAEAVEAGLRPGDHPMAGGGDHHGRGRGGVRGGDRVLAGGGRVTPAPRRLNGAWPVLIEAQL